MRAFAVALHLLIFLYKMLNFLPYAPSFTLSIMFESREPMARIKLLDFGLSKKFMPGSSGLMTDWVGTVYTMAPQVRNRYLIVRFDSCSTLLCRCTVLMVFFVLFSLYRFCMEFMMQRQIVGMYYLFRCIILYLLWSYH